MPLLHVETCSRDYVHVFKDYDAARRVSATEQIRAARAAHGEGRPRLF